MNYTLGDAPGKSGHYPIVICYDANEGLFSSVDLWDGNSWKSYKGRVVFFGGCCESKEDAEALAEKHGDQWY